jgi:hypothetical protein
VSQDAVRWARTPSGRSPFADRARTTTTPPTGAVDGVVGIVLLSRETWTVRAGSSVSQGC